MHDESMRSPNEGLRSYPPSGDRETSELRLRIDEKRERLTRAAEAIERRFSPDRVLRPLAANLKDVAVGTSSTLTETVKENPVALVLAALGLGWLLVRPRRDGSRGKEGGERQASLVGKEAAEKARGAARGLR